jgi:protein SCO1/2
MQTGTESESESPALLRLLPRVILGLSLVVGAAATYRVVSGSISPSKAATSEALEVYGAIPDFHFTAESGASFSKQDMLGKVTIANFIFTRCPTVCPVFTMKMQRVAEQTSPSIQLLSFSVDPEYDTPERLAAYADEHGADTTRWHFLTGDYKAVKETVEGALKISMQREGSDENGVPDIVHGTHFVLFDGAGQIRGYYNADDQGRIATMIRDAKSLSK